MSSLNTLRSYSKWQNKNAELCFFALLVSGGLLLGSSIAYPMLSQDCSALAPVALGLFFLSAGCFNTLKIPEIYLYGYLTVVGCFAAMVLIMAFGRTTPDEHCRFLPVYFMASSFMTSAWPSLFRSLGLPLKTMETLDDHFDLPTRPQPRAPMAESPHQYRPMDPSPESLEAQDMQIDALLPQSAQIPLSNEASQEEGLPPVPAAVLDGLDLLHMGPSPDCTRRSAHTGSISLESRASLPSEMSDDVRLLFQPEIEAREPWAVPPRTTSRRVDIDALGRTYDFRLETYLRPSLQPRVRKSQSL